MADVEAGGAGPTTPLQKPRFNIQTTKLTKDSGTRGLFGVLCGTVCCYLPCALAALAIVNAFSIFLIVIGAMHKDDCSAEPNIGPLLIAMGVLAIVYSVVDSCVRTKSSQGDPEAPPAPPTLPIRIGILLNSIIKLVKFGIFVYLCVIVYRLYDHVEYHNTALLEDYCNRTLYLVAFWTLTLTFIVLGFVILSFLCCCCCLACSADK